MSQLDISWLSYHVHHVKLIRAARAIYSAFENRRTYVLTKNGGRTFYEDPQTREYCGEFLIQQMNLLSSWLQEVPEALKCRRVSDGCAYTTDGSSLDIDQYAPVWLQMQRLTLELLYHDIVISFYRPFICFPSPSISFTPISDQAAATCLKHAIEITNILYQVLAETQTLCGWHRAYQFQWDAALSMVAFAFAYPTSQLISAARQGVEKAISVFDMFGRNFAVATSAGRITRDLRDMVNRLSPLP